MVGEQDEEDAQAYARRRFIESAEEYARGEYDWAGFIGNLEMFAGLIESSPEIKKQILRAVGEIEHIHFSRLPEYEHTEIAKVMNRTRLVLAEDQPETAPDSS